MAFPNMLYCIGPLILLALLRDWRVAETDVTSVAKEVDNLKVQLKDISLRLHQLEKFKDKDLPQPYAAPENDRETDEPAGQRDRNTFPSWLNSYLVATGHGSNKDRENIESYQKDTKHPPSLLNSYLIATGHGLMKDQEICGSDENERTMRLEATVKKLSLALQNHFYWLPSGGGSK